ncbi:hypothetical protein CkaCkLH20_09165 [Colletotrichum karsti]|uniref:C2H2-type domain-containing protein n=1 Tax=Colletotrichum karsti TaxID=1095194 RepID=A0A9P6I051_9PEZI|nr:uncharacterized protein CkaCkLH20_09165 [Colletotrichum karsti]KAF9873352.1 hypothetical protein CkaCkLH20_09165 [Colletotrichum karsti]
MSTNLFNLIKAELLRIESESFQDWDNIDSITRSVLQAITAERAAGIEPESATEPMDIGNEGGDHEAANTSNVDEYPWKCKVPGCTRAYKAKSSRKRHYGANHKDVDTPLDTDDEQ